MELCKETGLRLLYSEERIQAEVRRLADAISADYEGQEIVLLTVLKGAFFFAADLARLIKVPLSLDFVRLSSYSGMETTGEVVQFGDIGIDIAGKNVLLIEDIIDTGLTLSYLLQSLRMREPKSIKVCALIDKKMQRRVDVGIDYAGIASNDSYLVGYGLDLNEHCRELTAIYEIVT
jgi:hypoxanthine phosphoribosyltransferase